MLCLTNRLILLILWLSYNCSIHDNIITVDLYKITMNKNCQVAIIDINFQVRHLTCFIKQNHRMVKKLRFFVFVVNMFNCTSRKYL
jgi:hypothetical protein